MKVVMVELTTTITDNFKKNFNVFGKVDGGIGLGLYRKLSNCYPC